MSQLDLPPGHLTVTYVRAINAHHPSSLGGARVLFGITCPSRRRISSCGRQHRRISELYCSACI